MRVAINLPIGLDGGIHDRIKKAYSSVIEEVGEPEWSYIKERLPRVLKRVRKSRTMWTANLCRTAEAIFDLLNQTATPQKQLLPETKRLLIAALFYFCNPYDVLPDYTPGTGYIDDAIVFKECLTQVKKLQPALYKRTFGS